MTSFFSRPTLLAAGVSALLLMPVLAIPASAETGGGEGATAAPPPPDRTEVRVIGPNGKPEVEKPAPQSDIERYCGAISDPARDARTAAQQKRLKDIEAEVNHRIDVLEAKRAEYQQWLKERQAFLDSTSNIMVDIYAKMKPDAAALQLAAVDRGTAAAVLARLKTRAASAILTEMPAAVAAELGNIIVAKTSKTPDGAMAGSGKG